MVIMNLELGIISGDQKRALECYVDSRFFVRRKSYDEYYVEVEIVEFRHGVNDLMILAEDFDVSINSNSITLKNN